jgi:putative membrane protein
VRRREPAFLLALGVGLLVLSGIHPKDRYTWILEVAPAIAAAVLLAATYRRFPLTPLAYRLILLHACILMVGGHYTYAEVPLGFWVQRAFGLARNHYDRLGHFAQGFVPAIVAREVLLRKTPLRRGGWTFFLVTCVCLAISAFYELVEWWTAVASGEAANAFLGTQGDPWDTQWDMFFALIGAVTAQLTLSRVHDRELARLAPGRSAEASGPALSLGH